MLSFCFLSLPGFDACIKGGVKLFDTAEIYGPGRSEELLGKFLRESGAKDVQVGYDVRKQLKKKGLHEIWQFVNFIRNLAVRSQQSLQPSPGSWIDQMW